MMEWNIDFEDNITEEHRQWMKQTLKAQLLVEEERYGEAAQELWEILTEARASGDRRWECITLAHQGSVYRNIRNGICQKLLEQALEMSEQIGFNPAKLIALTELGETACLWGKLERAQTMLQEALSLVEPGRERDRRAVLLRLAMASEAQGDVDRAKSLVDEVLLIDRKLRIPSDEDREHRERLNGASEPTQERVAS